MTPMTRPHAISPPESRRDASTGELGSLSLTEKRVIEAVAIGMSRQEVATALRLSIHTVGHSLTAAKEKLYARTIAEAAANYILLTTARPGPSGAADHSH
jgi:DNA-binding CsgD family transcriptional regulator